MREDEFRDRLHGALGEPPPMPSPRLRPGARTLNPYPHVMGIVAIAIAIVLVVVLVGSRLAFRTRGDVLPAATPSTRAVQPAADSFPCYLPVNMVQEAGDPGQAGTMSSTLGFINVPAGNFVADPNATVSDLPGGSDQSPKTYSAVLRRWLPARATDISPDGQSYAYMRQLPAVSELHVVRVADRQDRTVWTTSESAGTVGWNSAGILVAAVPRQGGVAHAWRIDPESGAATAVPPSNPPEVPPMSLMTGRSGSVSYVGSDGQGRAVYWFGSRDPGTAYSVALFAGGALTTIYSGKVGDGTDFEPDGFYSDAHGLWFGNFDGTRVWVWSQASGLHDYEITGGPARPSGYQFYNVEYFPAGPCVPGTSEGSGAQPLTAASPTPPPPVVDWTPLLAKPLALQDVQAGASCPVTPRVSLSGQTNAPKKGMPDYGYGRSPVYLSGQITWYSAGSQGVVFLTDPSYSGPVLVRTRRLDGAGAMSFTGDYSPVQNLAGGAIGIPETSSPPYWGLWNGGLSVSAPGCYGIQFDGTSFSEQVIIEVRQGPPPPG